MAKRWCVGKVPRNGALLAAMPGDPGWMLFDVSDGAGPWWSLKLVAMAPVFGGANFRFGWDGKRLASGTEPKRLHALSPAVLDWVVQVMKGVRK